MQRLPTGDWWSSVSSSYPSLSADGKSLKDLSAAYAELVAVLPTPSSTLPEAPTLGPCRLEARVKTGGFETIVPPMISKFPSETTRSRQISCGKFLDYGPYSSFAPVFQQDGVEIGCVQLGELIWQQERERRSKRHRTPERLEAGTETSVTTGADALEAKEAVEVVQLDSKQEKTADEDVDSALQGLLSPEQVASLKDALGSLELENAVQELLDRNARALTRLEVLQKLRLRDGGKAVEAGSEEWAVGK